MKRKITIILMFIGTILLNAQEIKYVNASKLNIREGAGKKYNVIAKAYKNEKVKIISEQGNWSEIETDNGIKGYVSSSFLSVNSEIDEAKKGKTDKWNIIVFVILMFLVYKARNFIYAIFGPSNSKKSTTTPNYNSTQKNVQQKKIIGNISRKDNIITIYDETGRKHKSCILIPGENLMGFTQSFYITIKDRILTLYNIEGSKMKSKILFPDEHFQNCIGNNYITKANNIIRTYDIDGKELNKRIVH